MSNDKKNDVGQEDVGDNKVAADEVENRDSLEIRNMTFVIDGMPFSYDQAVEYRKWKAEHEAEEAAQLEAHGDAMYEDIHGARARKEEADRLEAAGAVQQAQDDLHDNSNEGTLFEEPKPKAATDPDDVS